jgi:hypothetical protein
VAPVVLIYCVVCSSSICGFWLPLWHLQTLLTWVRIAQSLEFCLAFCWSWFVTWYCPYFTKNKFLISLNSGDISNNWTTAHVVHINKKSLKIPKALWESVNRRRTDNTMTKRKKTKEAWQHLISLYVMAISAIWRNLEFTDVLQLLSNKSDE